MTDRALSWTEWRQVVFDANRDEVWALQAEVDAAVEWCHPLGYGALREWIDDLKDAVHAADLERIDLCKRRIRAKLVLEREWSGEDDAVAEGGQ